MAVGDVRPRGASEGKGGVGSPWSVTQFSQGRAEGPEPKTGGTREQ